MKKILLLCIFMGTAAIGLLAHFSQLRGVAPDGLSDLGKICAYAGIEATILTFAVSLIPERILSKYLKYQS